MTAQILFRTEPSTKALATKRAKSDGIALQKVLHSLLSAYASGDIHIDLHISAGVSTPISESTDNDIPETLYAERKADYLNGRNTVSWSEVRARLENSSR